MARTKAKTQARAKKPAGKDEAKAPAPARDAKPTFGKAPPRRVAAGSEKAGRASVKTAKPAAGSTPSIGQAAKAAAAVAVGTVVATARGMASLASSVRGRAKTKDGGNSK